MSKRIEMTSWGKATVRETVRDGLFLGVVFLNWIVCALIVDAAAPENLGVRKGASIYIALFSIVVNAWSFGRSVSFLKGANAPSESIFGLFAEILNVTQVWGTMYAASRYWSLPDEHLHMRHSLLHAESESIFEMSLVQAGIGWSSEPPITLIERLVAWAAAYIGGVLFVNMFLLSIVFGSKFVAEPPGAAYTSLPVSAGWKFSLAREGAVAA